MKLLDALTKLQRLDLPVIETGDTAVVLGLNKAHAGKIVSRLAEAGFLLSLRRGVWAFPGKLDPMAVPERLTAPEPAYVSLQSALYHYGMISQIPSLLYAVSPARTRRYNTPLGVVSIHHVDPAFFFGFETIGEKGIRIARPEKALLDVFYLSPSRTRLFARLPEVEKPDDFDIKTAYQMIAGIPFPARRNMVARRFESWLESCSRTVTPVNEE